MAKCNAKKHIELNRAYVHGEDKYDTKMLQAMCIIMSADSDWYSGIWNDLKNSTILGTENYPKITTAAYNVMCCYKKRAPPRQVHAPPAAVTFLQRCDKEKNKITPGNDGRYFK